jgi:nucleoside-diphosphate-sugar epimerase
MKRLLVTGAAGFLGRHCLEALEGRGFEIHALSRSTKSSLHSHGFAWHSCDLLQRGASTELIEKIRPSHVLHLAWYATPGKFWQARENQSWVGATEELWLAFAESGGQRFVGAGSCAEYGLHSGECFESVTALEPESLYGKCKLATQRRIASRVQDSGVRTAWGRIFFMYGPFEPPDKVVPYVIRSLLSGQPALCSSGDQILDFLHVQDVASALVALLNDDDASGVFNIGSGVPVRLREVLSEIGRSTDAEQLIQFGARRSSMPQEQIWANIQKITSQTGWGPTVNLQQGIRDTVEWWRGFSTRP